MRIRILFGVLAGAWLGVCVLAAAQTGQIMRASVKSDREHGELVFEKSCEVCHFSASKDKKIGPGLEGLMKQKKFADGKRANDANLRQIIERGGKDMPGFSGELSSEQIRELITYLKTL